jgi:hypothetical protein
VIGAGGFTPAVAGFASLRAAGGAAAMVMRTLCPAASAAGPLGLARSDS